MDKILQPHESHIPFLLQFKIDYNLYGMGHLHASKMKFRYPVPDVFSQRRAKHQGPVKLLTDDPTDSQSDLVGDLRPNTPIWISSTIPDGWISQYSHEPDSSTYNEVPLFRRHSTTQLEGDLVVDDILNKQLISYASLSQTQSEVKMVQSLIPIWEEEYERNGVAEAVPPDPAKPPPQDVLRILSDDVTLEKIEKNDADSCSILTPASTSSTETGNLIDSGLVNIENSTCSPSKYLKASDLVGALLWSDSSFQNADAAETNEIGAGDQLQTSTTIGPSSAKATDGDVLGLLKWLASSQAAEDINSDDELAREIILSPLLPSKDIDKVLERANLDYDSESQKECQDILDSVDMINSEEYGRASDSTGYRHSSKASASNIIPQLDGSSDDLQSIPYPDNSLQDDTIKAKVTAEVHSWSKLESDLICEHRRKRPRWGPLPIACGKSRDVLHSNSLSILTGSDNEKKENLGTSWSGDESEKFPCIGKVDEKKDASYTDQARVVLECSTRDLMRKKRSHRIELSESRNLVEDRNAESYSDAECGNGGDSRLLGGTNCHESINSTAVMCNVGSHIKPTSSCFPILGSLPLSTKKDLIEAEDLQKNGNPECEVRVDPGEGRCDLYDCVDYDSNLHVGSCMLQRAHASETGIFYGDSAGKVLQTSEVSSWNIPSECDLPSKNKCVSESGCQNFVSMGKLLDVIADDKKMEGETTSVQFDTPPNWEISPGLSNLHGPLNNVSKEVTTGKLIRMTFSKKPPRLEWPEEAGSEAPQSIGNEESNFGLYREGRFANDCLPFFVRNCAEEELPGVKPKRSGYILNNESVMGVPTLYQNDGSYLFILTPAVSPPSRESVDRWISAHNSNMLGQDASVPSLQILKESSGDMMGSQDSLADVSNTPLSQSASSSDEKPNCNQLPEHHQDNFRVKLKSLSETKKPSSVYSQDISQISGPDKITRVTPLSQVGFRDPASVGQGQQLTLLSMEVQAESRGDLRPNPRFDAINVIVLVFQEDDESTLDVQLLLRLDSANNGKDLDAIPECKVFVFSEELQLLNHFTQVIRASDPDVIMGWDVQSSSLGFLAERAAHLGLGLLNNISRTPSETTEASGDMGASEKKMVKEMQSESVTAEAVNLESTVIEDEWGRTHASGVHVGGRIVLNIWRLMRNEVKLNMYTLEAVAESLLRQKTPYIPSKVLTRWFLSGPGRARYRSIEYVLERAKLNLHIMNQLDMINRTSELARVFGIDFFSVLSRGSQYRVESMLLRLAHTQNYLAISPGNQQVANQPAMECLPLVMEPESSFYADPVIVLDFQSLYPSMVIAYNLCFCTCLGKITPPRENTLGVSSYSPDMNVLRNSKRELLVTPNGVVYVPSKARKGILPRLLEEILSTRIMVKQAMKRLAPSQQVLHRILNARQLALKLIANVTYGYTAAGFSGRMPCAELADSIVQCGRRTLETAISFVNSNDKWKARVIYGDTDSMFVLLKGRSLKEAFKIGREIASAITEMNPSPVTLKMEKVYYPCFLLTKKRYVGYSYESPDQSKPIFDAKGIETVRRDTCAAVSKTMEQSLRIYFESHDVEKVKAYVLRQWTRILSGRISVEDFIFAKEVRLGTYSARASSLPPGAIVATKLMRADPRAEPRYAERVPYVVVHGEPGARLVDMVVDPLDLLSIGSPFRLNDIYYIRKQIIPALQRVFGLVGADLNKWFLEMPRPGRETVGKRHPLVQNPQRTRIDFYYASKHCVLCGDLVQGSAHLCNNCSRNETSVALALTGRTSKLEKNIQHLAAICGHCGGGDWRIESGVKCVSLACSVFYERIKVAKELQSLSQVTEATGLYPKCMVEWF